MWPRSRCTTHRNSRRKMPAWLYLRGVIARAQKHNTDARSDFQAALALDDVYLPIRYRLADTLIDLGDLDGAHKVLAAALPKHGNDAALLSMLGRLELKQKNYADADRASEQALKLEPKANALYKDLAKPTVRKAITKKPRARKPRSERRRRIWPIRWSQECTHPEPSLHGTALEQAQATACHASFLAGACKGCRGRACQRQGCCGAGLECTPGCVARPQRRRATDCNLALKLKPDDAAANLSQGMVYEFGGDDAKALPFYQRAVQVDPLQADARLLLGNALMRRGKYAAGRSNNIASWPDRSGRSTTRMRVLPQRLSRRGVVATR